MSEKKSFQRKNCRLCNKKDLEPVIQLTPTPLGDLYLPKEHVEKIKETYPLDLFLCKECSFLQLSDVVNPELLYGNYIYSTSDSLGLVKHFNEYADDVIHYLEKGDLVIDIGSNEGSLLKAFKSKGMRVLGIEPAKRSAKKAEQQGIETIQKFFTSGLAQNIRKDYGPASLITANNVLANIDNLDDVIAGVRTLLSPQGAFVFETGYLPDLIKNNILDNIYHEHLSYFSVKSLDSFFNNRGMKLIDIKHLPTKGGSIRGIAQFAEPKTISSSVKKFIKYENQLGIDKKETFKAFHSRIKKEKKRIADIVKGLKQKQKTIAGYGASVGATTMLYELDLGNSLDFLIDDNISRQGLVSPGFHLPVLPPRSIYEEKPDSIVILAWRYSEVIMNKHKKYLKKKGNFIVPFSNLEVNKTY